MGLKDHGCHPIPNKTGRKSRNSRTLSVALKLMYFYYAHSLPCWKFCISSPFIGRSVPSESWTDPVPDASSLPAKSRVARTPSLPGINFHWQGFVRRMGPEASRVFVHTWQMGATALTHGPRGSPAASLGAPAPTLGLGSPAGQTPGPL